MTITHKIDQFLQKLFPKYKKSNDDFSFEIPMLGRGRIGSARTDYKLNAIPSKTYSGYQVLDCHYVNYEKEYSRIKFYLNI